MPLASLFVLIMVYSWNTCQLDGCVSVIAGVLLGFGTTMDTMYNECIELIFPWMPCLLSASAPVGMSDINGTR